MSRLIFHEKKILDDEYLLEMEIRQVKKEPPTPEGVKYSLVLIRRGQRILGYDNHERKGHHKHLFEKESPYKFTTVNRLIEEFEEEVKKFVERGKK